MTSEIDPEDRRRALESARQTAPIYRAIGRLVVAYSEMIHQMESAILLYRARDSADQQWIRAILNQLPDKGLCEYFAREVEEALDNDKADLDVARNILNRVRAAIEARNRTLHSLWRVGYGNDQTTDWSKATAVRPKRRGKIGALESREVTADSVLDIANDLDGLHRDAMRLAICAFDDMPRRRSLVKNFVKDERGNYRDPSYLSFQGMRKIMDDGWSK